MQLMKSKQKEQQHQQMYVYTYAKFHILELYPDPGNVP
jgi:hypothetical protein